MPRKFLLKTVLWGFAACKCWCLEPEIAQTVEAKANRMARESFRAGNDKRAAVGAATNAKLSCFLWLWVGWGQHPGGQGQAVWLRSVPAPPVGLGKDSGCSSHVKGGRNQGRDPLHDAQRHPDSTPSISPNTAWLPPQQPLLFWMFFPGPPAPCLCEGKEGGESQNRGRPIFRLAISHSLEGWVPIRWCCRATLACV